MIPRADVSVPEPTGRVLEPMDRISEVLFGVIMVLTFTGSISVAESGHSEIRALLVGAIGCNVAWGIIDGVMYLMAVLSERGRAWTMVRAFKEAPDDHAARRVLHDALPTRVAAALEPQELETMRAALAPRIEVPPKPGIHRRDLRGALGVFLLVSLSTFPVVLPFLFVPEAHRALRLSNAVAIVMLFVTGWAYGRAAARRPWTMGLAMVAVGLALVALTIALGG